SASRWGGPGAPAGSTWKGTPGFLSAARNRAMSSPSTSPSVSASSRCAPGPASTNVAARSPATTPSPIRIASAARWDARGSVEMTTTTGSAAFTTSVEGDEAVGPGEHVGQHDEAAGGDAVELLQRDAAPLTAVGAGEELGAAGGEPPHARGGGGADGGGGA